MNMTNRRRNALSKKYAKVLVENWTIDFLLSYAVDSILMELKNYSEEQLLDEIKNYHPELIEQL